MKAVGLVWKNEAGNWHASITTGHPDTSCSFESMAKSKMKEAMDECNDAAERLGWEISGWEK